MTTPPHQISNNQYITERVKKRDSNLELYRVIIMLLIIAHHYVVNSGLMEIISQNPDKPQSIIMLIFGAWGKTGINCFMLITGYYMCKGTYSLRKLIRLYSQILFYSVIIYSIFLVTGHEKFTIIRLLKVLIPIFDLSPSNFVGCFLVFFLFIPFLNILINHLTQRQHGLLSTIVIIVYSILPTLNSRMPVNYIGWFCAIYFIASYIRYYGFPIRLSTKMWGFITLVSIIISCVSIFGLTCLASKRLVTNMHIAYYFVADSNKILALVTSLSSFMLFKDLKIPYSKFINIVGGTTFGVFLIHTNSNAMRQWLWKETVDCQGHFTEDIYLTILYALGSVAVIFIICSGIDWFRGKYIEPYLMPKSEKLILYCKSIILNKLKDK